MAQRAARAVPDEIWSAEQVAAYLKLIERTIRDWRERHATFPQPLDLPGRSLRWYWQDVVDWTLSARGVLTG